MSGYDYQNLRHFPKRGARTKGESLLAQSSLHVVDAGFLGMLFIAPLFFGGRHDMGRLVVVLLAIMVSLAWCCRQIVREGGTRIRTRIHGILAAAIGLIIIQLVPLPGRWVELLSPRTTSLLPLWSASVQGTASLGEWHTLSLTPSATRIALVMILAFGLLLLTALERFRKLTDIERLLNWIALASIAMAAFAILEYFTSNGLFLWFYQHPFRATGNYTQGSFVNRNHFAHFLVLGIGPLLAWIVRQQQQEHRPASRSVAIPVVEFTPAISKKTFWLIAGLVLVLFAIFLSLSRGGTIAMVVALVTALGLFYRAGQVSYRTFFVAGSVVVLMLGMLSLYGYERVSSRLDDLSAGSLEKVDSHEGRRRIWAANVAAIQAGGFFGSGAGSHRDIYRIYMEKPYVTEYTHAESGYLQIATENGIVGVVVMLFAIGTIAIISFQSIRSRTSPRISICIGAVTASLIASLIHSVVDFIWFIPACLSMTLLLAACAVNLSRQCLVSQDKEQSSKNAPIQGRVWASRKWWLATGIVTLLVGTWMMTEMLGPAVASIHWDRYLRASVANSKLQSELTGNRTRDTSHVARSREMYLTEMFAQLQKVVHWYPDSPRARLRMASRHLNRFNQLQQQSENVMGLTQIRDAAMASGFASSEELRNWLTRAFGENSQHLYQAYMHARQAIQLNPLQGEAYLHLANLCFLAGHQVEIIDVYLDQCLSVRPQESAVLFEVGKQHLLLGRIEQAIHYWTRAFSNYGSHQRQIVQHMAGQISAATFIEVFHPDWQSLTMVWQRYCEVGQSEDLLLLVNYAAGIAEEDVQGQTSAKQGHIWLSLATMQSHLEQTDAALASLQKAYQADSNNYRIRSAMGFALLKMGQFSSAESHLHWCLARKPGDRSLQNARVRAAKGRLSEPLYVARQPEKQHNQSDHQTP
jgi:O-antigen ligase/tetratricopeptide (TPR) repeat protein